MGQRGTPVAKRNQNLRHAYVFDISSHCRFSSRQRWPTSEATLFALASALGWTLLELEMALLEALTTVAM